MCSVFLDYIIGSKLKLFTDAVYVFVLKSELAFVHKSLTLNSPKYRQNERLSTTGDKRGTKVH